MSLFRNPSKKQIVFLSIIGLLILFRLFLPYIVKTYVNKVLADLDGYKGHVEDIDIWLIRGAYVINELKIDKTGGKVPVPFIYSKTIDLSVEWRALLKGGIKAKVIFGEPVLTFVAGPSKASSQTGAETDWTKPLKKLLPIDINRFEIHNGKIKYNDFHSSPKVDIFINDFDLVATNISNLVGKGEKLPSDLTISGSSIGGGNLSIKGKMNLVKVTPDADINMKFTSIKLTALNDFAKAYGKFDFESGKMDLFSEVAVNDGKVDGYIKPILENVKILNWKEDGNLMQKTWQAAVGLTFDVFKNHPKDQFATKVPLHGNLDKKVETNVVTTIIRVLKNAFVEAYSKSLDNSVSFTKDSDEGEKKFLFFKVKEKGDK
ncbi:MAG: DUF748 domain-containing protein [Cytophagales bacterium]|nr:DUF748 domain-containing protein [Cytophaga sp.]